MLQKLLSSYCAWRLLFCPHYLHAWNFETHANLGSVGALESCQSFEEPCTGAAISKGWCLLQIPRRGRYKPLPTPLCSGREYVNTGCLQRLTQTRDLSSAGSWEAFLVPANRSAFHERNPRANIVLPESLQWTGHFLYSHTKTCIQMNDVALTCVLALYFSAWFSPVTGLKRSERLYHNFLL
jgi:hypothetical protein